MSLTKRQFHTYSCRWRLTQDYTECVFNNVLYFSYKFSKQLLGISNCKKSKFKITKFAFCDYFKPFLWQDIFIGSPRVVWLRYFMWCRYSHHHHHHHHNNNNNTKPPRLRTDTYLFVELHEKSLLIWRVLGPVTIKLFCSNWLRCKLLSIFCMNLGI